MQRTIQQVWFFILLGVVTLAFLWLTLDFIEPVFWAAVLAIIFTPVQRQMENLVRGRKTLAALLTTASIVIVVFLPLITVGVAVSREALALYDRIQEGSIDLRGILQRIDPILRDLVGRLGIDPASIEQRIYEAAGSGAQLIASQAIVVGQNVLSVVAKTALMLYLLFFFLRDGEYLLSVLGDAIPMGDTRQRALFSRFTTVNAPPSKAPCWSAWCRGQLVGCSSPCWAFAPRCSGV
jgi:predicted PurR-regulated permease PerM